MKNASSNKLCLLMAADVSQVASGRGTPLTPAAVRAAANSNRLRVAARTAGGVRLFDRADVEEFLDRRGSGRSRA